MEYALLFPAPGAHTIHYNLNIYKSNIQKNTQTLSYQGLHALYWITLWRQELLRTSPLIAIIKGLRFTLSTINQAFHLIKSVSLNNRSNSCVSNTD